MSDRRMARFDKHTGSIGRLARPAKTVLIICVSVLTGMVLMSCSNLQKGIELINGAKLTNNNNNPNNNGDKPEMKKQVAKDASFVVYTPSDWTVQSDEQQGYRTIKIADPKGDYEVVTTLGRDFSGGDAMSVAKASLKGMSGEYSNLEVTNAMTSGEKNRLVFDGTYSDSAGNSKEFRCWASVGDGDFSCSRIVAPKDKLNDKKGELLTVLSNVQAMKGAFEYTGGAAPVENLTTYKLSDGSCSFKMPQGWQVQEIGKGQFVAYDQAAGYSFTSASADAVTPALGLNNSPIPVSDYLPPSEALKFFGEKSGLLTNMNVSDVNDHPDLAQAMSQVYTVGKVQVEDFTYTCQTKEGNTAKGFTLGFSFDTRLRTNWSLRHLTVIAPEDKFDAYAPTFAAMMGSYTIDQEWARNYVAQGMARLRQMQQETSELVARNADDIHNMMNQAYQERQDSQDYIDYQRTSYIRGEQDWVSEMEGGTIYRSDAWGTKNTATGDYYEGQPYNYYNFSGDSPQYNEQMTPINSRELWEQHVR